MAIHAHLTESMAVVAVQQPRQMQELDGRTHTLLPGHQPGRHHLGSHRHHRETNVRRMAIMVACMVVAVVVAVVEAGLGIITHMLAMVAACLSHEAPRRGHRTRPSMKGVPCALTHATLPMASRWVVALQLAAAAGLRQVATACAVAHRMHNNRVRHPRHLPNHHHQLHSQHMHSHSHSLHLHMGMVCEGSARSWRRLQMLSSRWARAPTWSSPRAP